MNRRELLKVVKKFNATIDESEWLGGLKVVNIDAPKGKVWNDGELHSIVLNLYKGQPDMDKDYQDAIARMNYGLSDCTEEDCDICNDPTA